MFAGRESMGWSLIAVRIAANSIGMDVQDNAGRISGIA
jgi:hypothetical protein